MAGRFPASGPARSGFPSLAKYRQLIGRHWQTSECCPATTATDDRPQLFVAAPRKSAGRLIHAKEPSNLATTLPHCHPDSSPAEFNFRIQPPSRKVDRCASLCGGSTPLWLSAEGASKCGFHRRSTHFVVQQRDLSSSSPQLLDYLLHLPKVISARRQVPRRRYHAARESPESRAEMELRMYLNDQIGVQGPKHFSLPNFLSSITPPVRFPASQMYTKRP
jgi:hypothetical protein